jgi:hypothetical protein
MVDDFINSLGGSGAGTNTSTTADQLRNQVLSQLVVALQNALPQSTSAISATATAGVATLPANPTAFLTITVGSTAYKLPLYKV